MTKKQKTDSDLEEEEQLKTFLTVVPDEEGEVDYEFLDKRFPIVDWKSEFYHFDGSSRYIKTFTEMVTRFDRLNLHELHSLVKQRFETTTLEGIDLILWGDLKTMFETIHILLLEDGTEIPMLVEKRDPLIKETLERMLVLSLTVEFVSDAVLDLISFVKK
ncbi:hypothetical protein Tco_0766171 [Tanacetum coccineum]